VIHFNFLGEPMMHAKVWSLDAMYLCLFEWRYSWSIDFAQLKFSSFGSLLLLSVGYLNACNDNQNTVVFPKRTCEVHLRVPWTSFLFSKRPRIEPHGATWQQQAIGKTPAKWSDYQILTVIVIFVALVFKVYFVSLIPTNHNMLWTY
jgi:hypothetical protein